jgi:hypothetical protein
MWSVECVVLDREIVSYKRPNWCAAHFKQQEEQSPGSRPRKANHRGAIAHRL